MKHRERADVRFVFHIYSCALQFPIFLRPHSEWRHHPVAVDFVVVRSVHRFVAMSVQHFVRMKGLMHDGRSADFVRDAGARSGIQGSSTAIGWSVIAGNVSAVNQTMRVVRKSAAPHVRTEVRCSGRRKLKRTVVRWRSIELVIVFGSKILRMTLRGDNRSRAVLNGRWLWS